MRRWLPYAYGMVVYVMTLNLDGPVWAAFGFGVVASMLVRPGVRYDCGSSESGDPVPASRRNAEAADTSAIPTSLSPARAGRGSHSRDDVSTREERE